MDISLTGQSLNAEFKDPAPEEQAEANTANPNKDYTVVHSDHDSMSSMAFSPLTLTDKDLLIAGSWDNHVRCWNVEADFSTIPMAQQAMEGPVLDVCWHDNGEMVFMAGCDKQAKCWDLRRNQAYQVANHREPIQACRWINAPNYKVLMTCSWDRSIKFWDVRTPNPILDINVPERVYCADVDYPLAVVGMAGVVIMTYHLMGRPKQLDVSRSPLRGQIRCVSIFRDELHTHGMPTGYAMGNTEGRVALEYLHYPPHSFTFKCHNSEITEDGYQDVYAVNDIAFHPIHKTLATVGSDGRYSFWDANERLKLKVSEPSEQAITTACFNKDGRIFAYAVSYDWSKGHTYHNPGKENHIFIRDSSNDSRAALKG